MLTASKLAILAAADSYFALHLSHLGSTLRQHRSVISSAAFTRWPLNRGADFGVRSQRGLICYVRLADFTEFFDPPSRLLSFTLSYAVQFL